MNWGIEMTEKNYPLSVYSIPELEEFKTIAYQSKGHHDKYAFAVTVIGTMDLDGFNKDFTLDNIQENTVHVWQKVVPWVGGRIQLINSDVYKKGWYPVIFIAV